MKKHNHRTGKYVADTYYGTVARNLIDYKIGLRHSGANSFYDHLISYAQSAIMTGFYPPVYDPLHFISYPARRLR